MCAFCRTLQICIEEWSLKLQQQIPFGCVHLVALSHKRTEMTLFSFGSRNISMSCCAKYQPILLFVFFCVCGCVFVYILHVCTLPGMPFWRSYEQNKNQISYEPKLLWQIIFRLKMISVGNQKRERARARQQIKEMWVHWNRLHGTWISTPIFFILDSIWWWYLLLYEI